MFIITLIMFTFKYRRFTDVPIITSYRASFYKVEHGFEEKPMML